jgi:hypothetical protein
MVEREYKKLQEKHRETLNSEYNLRTAKEHLETSIRVLQEDFQKMNHELEESLIRAKSERNDLSSKLKEFSRAYEKAKDENG